jgi:drug/metabolite transporter (DMT)-like permease
MKFRVFFLYALLCLIWGTTWLAIKISLNGGTPPIFGVGLRFLIAGAVLWLLFFLRREKLPLDRRAISLYLLFGVLNFSLSYGITYWATQYIYSNLAALLWAGFPFVVAALAHWVLPDDRLTAKKVFSVGVGTIGVVLIVTEGRELGGSHVTIGILVIILAVLIAAWPNIYLKQHQQVVNTLQLNTVSQSLAGVLLLGSSFWLEADQTMVWSTENVIALLYLAIPGSVLTWLIYFWLFRHMTVTQISYVAFFPPVIATLLGWFLLNEALTPVALVGAVLVLTGALLINLPEKSAAGD